MLQILALRNQKEKGGRNMSAKQKYIVLAALVVTLIAAAGLLYYSMAQTTSYDGVFVSSVRQMWR